MFPASPLTPVIIRAAFSPHLFFQVIINIKVYLNNTHSGRVYKVLATQFFISFMKFFPDKGNEHWITYNQVASVSPHPHPTLCHFDFSFHSAVTPLKPNTVQGRMGLMRGGKGKIVLEKSALTSLNYCRGCYLCWKSAVHSGRVVVC